MTRSLSADDLRAVPACEASEDSLGELLLDCHAFLTALLARQHGHGVGCEARELLARLDDLVGWGTVH